MGELAAAHDLDPRYLQRWLADRPYIWEGLLPSDFLKITSRGCFDWTQIRQTVDGDTKTIAKEKVPAKLRSLVESIPPERQHAASCTLMFRRRQDLLLYLGVTQRVPSLPHRSRSKRAEGHSGIDATTDELCQWKNTVPQPHPISGVIGPPNSPPSKRLPPREVLAIREPAETTMTAKHTSLLLSWGRGAACRRGL